MKVWPLVGNIALCSWVIHYSALTLLLSTRVYKTKMGTGELNAVGNPAMD